MIFGSPQREPVTVTRRDATHPLASYSRHGFHLDGADWPSAEHYYQAMKFDDAAYREQIRSAAHPADAEKLGRSKRHGRRRDWDTVKTTYMTRAVYIKCRTHAEVAETLLATGAAPLLESSQYDYFWGCGRDLRGENAYGKVLMAVRDRLRAEGDAADEAHGIG